MSEVTIKIQLEMNGDAAIRIAKCLKKNEPELWEQLRNEISSVQKIDYIPLTEEWKKKE